MRIVPLGLLILLACLSESASARSEAGVVPMEQAAALPKGLRCLPVVAAPCGCVYTCGVGTVQPNGSYRIRHTFWKDSELTGRIDRWCVKRECTDAFFADIVCTGVCAAKPADPTCHFEGANCVSSRQTP